MTRMLAITPGDPAGVGPELAVAIAMRSSQPICLIADRDMLRARAGLVGLAPRWADYDPHGRIDPSAVTVLHVPAGRAAAPGKLDPENAGYVLETLRIASQLCMDGAAGALVTGPVHKAVINRAGIKFTGHTEFLAQLSGAPMPVMLLASDAMRVALVTTHLPLRAVSAAIDAEHLGQVLDVLCTDLSRLYGLSRPRVAVLGLNPHAGEGGHMGTEEINTIEPAIRAARLRLVADISGPIPADTAFTPGHLRHVDAVLAMYHDQGLPVIKASGFGDTVNVTLGLPFIRTSVDHGTACDLAGTGAADAGSFERAVALAASFTSQAVAGTGTAA